MVGLPVVGSAVTGCFVVGFVVVGIADVSDVELDIPVVGSLVVGLNVVGVIVDGEEVVGDVELGACVVGAAEVGDAVVGFSVERSFVVGNDVVGDTAVGDIDGLAVVGVDDIGLGVGAAVTISKTSLHSTPVHWKLDDKDASILTSLHDQALKSSHFNEQSRSPHFASIPTQLPL